MTKDHLFSPFVCGFSLCTHTHTHIQKNMQIKDKVNWSLYIDQKYQCEVVYL